MKDNIILIAATNRPDILDPALAAPGSLRPPDRRRPADRKAASKILEVHTRGKPLAKVVGWTRWPRRRPASRVPTCQPGQRGRPAGRPLGRPRDHRDTPREGIMRVIAAPRRSARVMSEKERRITAFHEMGHAIVGHFLENTDPVHKISVNQPRPGARLHDLAADRGQVLTTRAELKDTMAMTLGGRAAEEIIFGEVTTGASTTSRSHGYGQADGHALRDEREARPARLRTRPRPAVPGREFSPSPTTPTTSPARSTARSGACRGGPSGGAGHPHRAPCRARCDFRDLLRRETIEADQFNRLLQGESEEAGSAPTRSRRRAPSPRRPAAAARERRPGLGFPQPGPSPPDAAAC